MPGDLAQTAACRVPGGIAGLPAFRRIPFGLVPGKPELFGELPVQLVPPEPIPEAGKPFAHGIPYAGCMIRPMAVINSPNRVASEPRWRSPFRVTV